MIKGGGAKKGEHCGIEADSSACFHIAARSQAISVYNQWCRCCPTWGEHDQEIVLHLEPRTMTC